MTIMKHLRHWSSSSPPTQSDTPSHTWLPDIHAPLPHVNWSTVQATGQSISSLPFLQSVTPSHTWLAWTHWRLLHWNSVSEHTGGRRGWRWGTVKLSSTEFVEALKSEKLSTTSPFSKLREPGDFFFRKKIRSPRGSNLVLMILLIFI